MKKLKNTEIAEEVEQADSEDVSDVGDIQEEADDESIEQQLVRQPFRVVYQTNNFLLPQIKDLVLDGEDFNLRPEYQRRLRWSFQQKSLLIESLLLNVPVPPVFFYENDLARYEVMDGQQRLNAIKEFLENEFKLRGLQVLSSLNGRKYSTLPPRVKRSLDRASISAIVLLQESQAKLKRAGSNRYYELRRFVFERLNTGGKRLSAQEIRNAIYGGAFNDLIVELSRNPVFTRIWGIPPYTKSDPNEYYEEPERQRNALYRTMGDCQLVLRFFALRDDDHIHGSMKSMLDRCMERNMEITKAQSDALGKAYATRLAFADELFDKQPFAISKAQPRPLAGIYDGVMVAVDDLWTARESLKRNKGKLQKAYWTLMEKEAAKGELTGAANTAGDIKARIATFKTLFAKYA